MSCNEKNTGGRSDLIKMFIIDFNFVVSDDEPGIRPPSSASDYADIDAQEVYDYAMYLGNNAVFCQSSTINGCALYPSRLGPVSAGNMGRLFPDLYKICRSNGTPVWSYFSVAQDGHMSHTHPHWCIPNTDFLAPETPWTDFLCGRIEEFLGLFPVEWLIFDAFTYGSFWPDTVEPRLADFMKRPFEDIIGRPLPENAGEITDEEWLRYKREIMARQFYRIRDTVRRVSPDTKISFNVPFWKPAEAIWADHPMLNESDGLLAESAGEALVEYLLGIKKPDQRLFLTMVNFIDGFKFNKEKWRKWYELGCDFQGYAWGIPPDWRPAARFKDAVDSFREIFTQL